MGPRDLYGERYADVYRALYVDHPQWRDKHELNLRIVRSLLRPGSSWLDLCCGQAWHFTGVPGGPRTGIDLSSAQLAYARRDNPDATFIEGDVLEVALPGRFDLVTSFWGAYSYLDDEARIARFLERAIGWTAPGGAVYLELITPGTLAAFNATGFAGEAGAAVVLRSPDGVAWRFRDPGGWHELTSPPQELFEARLAPWFEAVELRGVAATLAQLVATGRRETPT